MAQNNQQNGNNGNRGFAGMDSQKQRDIASDGGKAAHASGNANEFSSEEARRAGSMSHKNDGNQQSGNNAGNGGNSAGNNSGGGNARSGGNAGTRGGTPEQHAQAGSQSHKNDKR